METRVTKTNMEVEQNLVLDTCSEPDCGISIMVERDDKVAGRKFRCTACLMRTKMAKPA